MRPASLDGVSIAVTRAREQSSGFAARLQNLGARVLLCPTIRIVPPSSCAKLDQAIAALESYDWVIFTSVNGVERFAERFKKRKFPARIQTCAIGPATADAMRKARIPVNKISKDYVAESILRALPRVKGAKILIPRAAVARDVLPKELRRKGARVDVVDAYRTVIDGSGLSLFRQEWKAGRVDCVTFTSSSTVKNFFALLSATERRELKSNPRLHAASIGPVTTETLLRFGWRPAIVARKPTTELLARAILDYYRKGRNHHGKTQ